MDRMYNKNSESDRKWTEDVHQTAKEFIIEVLNASGTPLPSTQILDAMKRKYPNLCDDSIKNPRRPTQPKWEHTVANAMQTLKDGRKVCRVGDAWQIGGSFVKPPPPPPNEATKIAKQIQDLVTELVELAQAPKNKLIHEELVKMGLEMGQKLGKISEPGSGPVFRHDIWWKDNPYKQPSLVIEVCDKGALDKDILSLSWAWEKLGAKGILVIVDDKDYQNALNKLPPGGSTLAIRAADFAKLHSVLSSAGKDILKAMFGV